MNRRGFLKSLFQGAAVAAATVYCPRVLADARPLSKLKLPMACGFADYIFPLVPGMKKGDPDDPVPQVFLDTCKRELPLLRHLNHEAEILEHWGEDPAMVARVREAAAAVPNLNGRVYPEPVLRKTCGIIVLKTPCSDFVAVPTKQTQRMIEVAKRMIQ